MNSKILKTKIPENLKGLPDISFCSYRNYCPTYYKVNPLLLLSLPDDAENILPHLWQLNVEDVAEYLLEDLKHPELKEAFVTNNINGKALVFLEADKFWRMGIKPFELCKELAAKIQNLCKLDKDEFHRSISLTFRHPQVLYLWYKARNVGPSSYFMTMINYFKHINVIREETAEDRNYYTLLNHWNRIMPFKPWCPHVMIGACRRINPMTGTTKRQNFHPKDHPYILSDLSIYCLQYDKQLYKNK